MTKPFLTGEVYEQIYMPGSVKLAGPLFPIGIEHLIYMKFSVTVRHMVIKGI